MHSNYLFTYGTLMQGEELADYISRCSPTHSQPAWISGQLYNLPAGYPGLKLNSTGDLPVAGEVYHFEDIQNALQILDEVEGYSGPADANNLYERQAIEVILSDQTRIEAWVYVYALNVTEDWKIPSNDWRKR